MQLLTLIRIAHLVGLIMGLGGAVLLDMTILCRGVFRPVSNYTLHQSHLLSRVVSYGLLLLWLTGAALIWLNLQVKPEYLSNPKLWAKIIIVCILTINGVLIHNLVLPYLKQRVGRRLLDDVSTLMIVGFSLTASISVTSWFTPFVLGKASELNFVTPMDIILLSYAGAVLAIWGVLLVMMSSIVRLQDFARSLAAGTLKPNDDWEDMQPAYAHQAADTRRDPRRAVQHNLSQRAALVAAMPARQYG